MVIKRQRDFTANPKGREKAHDEHNEQMRCDFKECHGRLLKRTLPCPENVFKTLLVEDCAHHRRSGIRSKPMVARTASAAPKRNGAAGPYPSHKSPAIRLAGNAATPKAALKTP